MKRKILLTAVVAAWLVGSSAFASIARLAVLGTQPAFTSSGASNTAGSKTNVVNGSLWYDDDYNMFFNPATVVDHKNYITFSKGSSSQVGGEGGWVSALGDSFAYGVYMNRGGSKAAAYGDTANLVAPGLSAGTNTSYSGGNGLDTQRAIDLLFGGDTGIKWGGKLTWAYNRNQSNASTAQDNLETTARYWHLALGAQIMGLEPFLGTTVSTQSERNNSADSSKVKDRLDDFNIGVRYKYEAWTPYVTYRKFRRSGNGPGIDDPVATGDTQVQTHMNLLGLGVGHDTKVADGVHVLKNVGLYYNSVNDTTVAALKNRNYKNYVLPINFAIEADVASWLTLRAGAEYWFWNETKHDNIAASVSAESAGPTDKRVSNAGVASARIGSTVKLGKLHIDSAFGNGETAIDSNADQLDDSRNIGFDSNTFAMVTASYHW